ncbi:Protein of unknown function (DUF952) [Seminavis robusta]|uniref:Uncharacterized protein n=1 Tax=Seminavis robusta TaxID=568900 RepID=A0A9N8H4P6_9STRA|nr:Protein of unknown function (DUF952) [Seminavis robusta]|eukprot:Sro68_g038140.1 Protein of unknown function (DUF952) (285) ;mRNA; f:71594-72448
MPKLIGKATTVVEHDGLTISELAGGVATKEDVISIAKVTVTKPTSEPWLTLLTDERMCVIKGKVEFHYYDDDDNQQLQVLTATAGDTVLVSKGERFRPVFPDGDTEYIPVCTPAFTPDRCIREDSEETKNVAERLQKLHKKKKAVVEPSEKLYHMCQKSAWEEAVAAGKAYYPPTFEEDGFFTHATAVPVRLIGTANHFYTSVPGDWICIELSYSTLKDKAGIITQFEEAKPVGSTKVSEEFENWICPHIFGGIPSHIEGVVTNTFPMKRDDKGNYLCIEGLTD